MCFCGSKDPLASLGEQERSRAGLCGQCGQYLGGFSIRHNRRGPRARDTFRAPGQGSDFIAIRRKK